MNEGQASVTARRVAAHRLSFPRVGVPYGRPEDDRALHAAVAADVVVDRGSRMARYLRARTAFFDRTVVDGIAAGVRQIVVAGAGYDGRALRYAHPGVRWIELDHPDTQADKRACLAALQIDVSAIGFAAADFAAGGVEDALTRAGADPEVATLFLCEGVAGYLDLPTLTRLLRALAASSAADASLAISISLRPESDAQAQGRAQLDTAVTSMGEALQSSLARDDIEAFLAACGWDVVRASDPAGVDLAVSARSSAFVLGRRAG